MVITGKIEVKARNGKGFKVEGQENWFNAVDAVVPFLAKANKGDVVEVTFDKNGIKQIVTKVTVVNETATDSSNYTKPATKATYTPKPAYKKPEYKSNYGSPADIAGKEIGCAINAASTLLSGRTQEDPGVLAEMVKVVATELLNFMRASK